jgi:hypothetical protein
MPGFGLRTLLGGWVLWLIAVTLGFASLFPN